MRLTDDRYTREREACELALRLLRYEARSCLIRTCTGLSEDRVRKLYKTYLQHHGAKQLRRKRGKAPHEAATFMRNSHAHLEASLLAGILQSLTLTEPANSQPRWLPPLSFVERLCDAYDYYLQCMNSTDRTREAQFSFEHAWFLMQTLARGALRLVDCPHCGAAQLHDVLATTPRPCPFCEQKSPRPLAPATQPALYLVG
jgi:hypothetical protein